MTRIPLFLLIACCLIGIIVPSSADMRIRVDDGRTIILPLSADQIQSVEFDDGQRMIIETGDTARESTAATSAPLTVAPPKRPDNKDRRILRVGKAHALKSPSQAAAVAQDGDTVVIDADTYKGDFAVWAQNDLTIRSQGGWVRLDGEGHGIQGKAIWVITGNNVRVEGIEFFNAAVPDQNGAGIRAEGGKLTISHCYFHDNETGLLSWNEARSEIHVDHSVFADNYPRDVSARASGRMHNIYIGRISSFTLEHSYVTGAISGHNVKTRARNNVIRYNRIMDGSSGSASYQIDVSDGGDAEIVGNLIQQSATTENYTMVALGLENASAQGAGSIVAFNTMINGYDGGIFLRAGSGVSATMQDNILVGKGKVTMGSVETRNNHPATPPTIFADFQKLDLRPKQSEMFLASPTTNGGTVITPDFAPSGIAKSTKRPDAGTRRIAGAFPPAP